jgi:rod shape-determining protein MreD
VNEYQPHGLWLVVLTLLIAFVLAVMPFSQAIMWGRPEWVAIVVIFWVIELPHRFGVVSAWMTGLLLDATEGVVFGENAFALALTAHFTYLLHARLRVFPVWQQCLTVLVLVGLNQLACRVVQGMVSYVPHGWLYWLPTLVSALLWPWIMPLLRALARYYRVS